MPCWSIVSNEVDLKNPNEPIFAEALKQLGFHVNTAEYSAKFRMRLTADSFGAGVIPRGVSVTLGHDGTVTITTDGRAGANLANLTNQLKRAYSVEVVKSAGKRFGWNVTQTSETKMLAKRRV